MTETAAAAAEGPQAKLEDGGGSPFLFREEWRRMPAGEKRQPRAVAAPSGGGGAGFGHQAIRGAVGAGRRFVSGGLAPTPRF